MSLDSQFNSGACQKPIEDRSCYGFWFLNDRLEADELRRQLRAFRDAGYAGVVAHPRDGLLTPWLSAAWFTMTRVILDEASSLGLETWFYDENPYPSGLLGGRLLDDDPGAVSRSLMPRRYRLSANDRGLQTIFEGVDGLLRVYARPSSDEGRLGSEAHDHAGDWVDVTGHCGRVGTAWYLQGFREMGYGPMFAGTEANPRHWRAWTDRYAWSMDWRDAKPGSYDVVVIGRQERDNYRHGRMPDLLDVEVMRRFIDGVYARTEKALSPDLFARFAAAFMDEPVLAFPWPWNDALPDVYAELFDDDLWRRLADLADGEHGDRARQTRRRYRASVSALWSRSFVEPIQRWLAERGIPLTGHISPEEDPLLATQQSPGLRHLIKHFDVPGYDLVTLPFGALEDAKLIGPRLVSSIAHRSGKEHLVAEMLGCCGEDLTLAEMRRCVDWLAMHGFDRYVIHGQFYSLAGPRKREAPPSIFEQQPYWREADGLTAYMDDLARWIGSTEPVRTLAVVVPWSVFEGMTNEQLRQDTDLALRLAAVVGGLTRAGFDFDLLGDDELIDATVTGVGDDSRTGKHDRDATSSRVGAGNSAGSHSGKSRPGMRVGVRVGRATYQRLVVLDGGGMSPECIRALKRVYDCGVPCHHIGPAEDEPSRRSLVVEMVASLVDHERPWLRVGPEADVRVSTRCRAGGTSIERVLWNPGDEVLTLEWIGGESRRLRAMDGGTPLMAHDVRGLLCRFTLPPRRTVMLIDASGPSRPRRHRGSVASSASKRTDALGGSAAATPAGSPLAASTWTLELPDRNTLTLRGWAIGFTDEQGKAQVADASGIVTVPAPQPAAWPEVENAMVAVSAEQVASQAHANEHGKDDTALCVLRFEFDAQTAGCVEGLAWEADPSLCAGFLLNGVPLAPMDWLKSAGLIETLYQFGDARRHGVNALEWHVPASAWHALAAADPPRLLGRFLVDGAVDERTPRANLRAMTGDTLPMSEPRPWSELGLPHYSGTLRYTAALGPWEAASDTRVSLTAPNGQRDTFAVTVDGRRVGRWLWPGDAIDLPTGTRKVSLEVSNTLANRFEAQAVPSGLMGVPLWITTCRADEPASDTEPRRKVVQREAAGVELSR